MPRRGQRAFYFLYRHVFLLEVKCKQASRHRSLCLRCLCSVSVMLTDSVRLNPAEILPLQSAYRLNSPCTNSLIIQGKTLITEINNTCEAVEAAGLQQVY